MKLAEKIISAAFILALSIAIVFILTERTKQNKDIESLIAADCGNKYLARCIEIEARERGYSAAELSGIIYAESGFDRYACATFTSGGKKYYARGLMQVVSNTAVYVLESQGDYASADTIRYSAQHLYEPAFNLYVGCSIMRWCEENKKVTGAYDLMSAYSNWYGTGYSNRTHSGVERARKHITEFYQ